MMMQVSHATAHAAKQGKRKGERVFLNPFVLLRVFSVLLSSKRLLHAQSKHAHDFLATDPLGICEILCFIPTSLETRTEQQTA
jgi:hypothetical protein